MLLNVSDLIDVILYRNDTLLCVLLPTVIGKDWEHAFIEPYWKHRISKYSAKSRNSEQTSFCARYSEQSLNITEHSENSLNN
jgi:hypothetical protein